MQEKQLVKRVPDDKDLPLGSVVRITGPNGSSFQGKVGRLVGHEMYGEEHVSVQWANYIFLVLREYIEPWFELVLVVSPDNDADFGRTGRLVRYLENDSAQVEFKDKTVIFHRKQLVFQVYK